MSRHALICSFHARFGDNSRLAFWGQDSFDIGAMAAPRSFTFEGAGLIAWMLD
jgi:hypothetical protein